MEYYFGEKVQDYNMEFKVDYIKSDFVTACQEIDISSLLFTSGISFFLLQDNKASFQQTAGHTVEPRYHMPIAKGE